MNLNSAVKMFILQHRPSRQIKIVWVDKANPNYNLDKFKLDEEVYLIYAKFPETGGSL